MKKNKKAFSLIEVLVTIAIISILAGVVLVSMLAYAKKARSAKAQAQLSSVIPGAISCWGNAGTVNAPSSGGPICSIGTSYGAWPTVGSGDLSTYSYGTVSGTDYDVSSLSSWFFKLTSATDDAKICCNSALKGCKVDVSGSTCNATTPGS